MGKSARNAVSNLYCKHLNNLDLHILEEIAESGKELSCSDCTEQGLPQQKIVCFKTHFQILCSFSFQSSFIV